MLKAISALVILVILCGVQQLKAQTVQVQVTVVTASPLTNVYFGYSTFYPDNAYQIYSLGSLPASTTTNPDVITLTIPIGNFNHPDFEIAGLYSAGGVTASDSEGAPTGKTFEQFYFANTTFGVELNVAAGLSSGSMSEIYNFMTDGIGLTGDGQIAHYPIDPANGIYYGGIPVSLYNFSTGTFDGSASAVVVPEPSAMLSLLAMSPAIAIRRRKVAN